MKTKKEAKCPKCDRLSHEVILECGDFSLNQRHCVHLNSLNNTCLLNLNPPCYWCKDCFLHFHAWSVS